MPSQSDDDVAQYPQRLMTRLKLMDVSTVFYANCGGVTTGSRFIYSHYVTGNGYLRRRLYTKCSSGKREAAITEREGLDQVDWCRFLRSVLPESQVRATAPEWTPAMCFTTSIPLDDAVHVFMSLWAKDATQAHLDYLIRTFPQDGHARSA